MTSQSIPFETEEDKVGTDGNSKTLLKGIDEKNWKLVARVVQRNYIAKDTVL